MKMTLSNYTVLLKCGNSEMHMIVYFLVCVKQVTGHFLANLPQLP